MTRTQCVLKVADSHRNKSQLHKLSFMWPRNVSQEGPPESVGRVMNGQDTANHILVDIDAESQRDLLGDAGTATGAIMPLHFNDGVDQLLLRSLRARPTPALGREQHAVPSLLQ